MLISSSCLETEDLRKDFDLFSNLSRFFIEHEFDSCYFWILIGDVNVGRR